MVREDNIVFMVAQNTKLVFPKKLTQARIVARPNRFIIIAELNGEQVRCHCPTTGRIGNLNLNGLPCLLSGPHATEKRSTAYTVEAFAVTEPEAEDFQWIGINQTAMNGYVAQALDAGLLSNAFPVLTTVERERKLGNSRIDFLLNKNTWVEVKMPLTHIELALPKEKMLKPSGSVGTARMEKQLNDLMPALARGENAFIIAAFAYEVASTTRPKATQAKSKFPALTKALAAGLQHWQLSFSFHPTHLTVYDFSKRV